MPLVIAQVQTTDRQINQLQQNIKQALTPIFAEPTGTFQAYMSGCTTIPQTTLYWEQGVAGAAVTVSNVTPFLGTSNVATAVITGLPKGLWPAQTQYVQVPTVDNGTASMATAVIDTTGLITLYKTIAGASFTTSGSKGLYACNFTYVLGV